MRDQSEVIPGDYSPLRVELLSCAPKHHRATRQACRFLQGDHRQLYNRFVPSNAPVQDRLFVPNKRNYIQVKIIGSGGCISPVNYIVR
jgi:hypothetical protein